MGAQLEDGGSKGINGNEKDLSAEDSGTLYLFTRTGTTWVQKAYMKGSNTDAYDEFGGSMAFSKDGKVIAVGARGEASAAKGINGNMNDNSAMGAGAVYIFTRISKKRLDPLLRCRPVVIPRRANGFAFEHHLEKLSGLEVAAVQCKGLPQLALGPIILAGLRQSQAEIGAIHGVARQQPYRLFQRGRGGCELIGLKILHAQHRLCPGGRFRILSEGRLQESDRAGMVASVGCVLRVLQNLFSLRGKGLAQQIGGNGPRHRHRLTLNHGDPRYCE